MRATLDPTLAIDAQGRILMASDSVEAVFGWKPAELTGRNIKLLMPEPHHSQHDEYLERYRRTGITHILNRTREFEVLHRQGYVLPCELSVARADLDGHGGPFFIGSFRDITERKRSERALEESERRFRAIFDRSFSYMGLLDTAGNVLEANQAALDGAGLTRNDVVGKPFWETRWWAHSDEVRRQLQDAVRRAARGEFVRFETEHATAGEETRAIDFSLKPVRDGEGRVVMLIPEGRDITELKRAQRAETAMLRALATIGESAAMLAHEIKNPITAVNMALRAVAHQLGEDQQAVLEDLVERMKRLENIMRRTLGFSRPLELRRAPVDAAELMSACVRDLRADVLKRGAEVEVACAAGEVTLHADRGLLGEVLSNLVRNALEAVGERGRVRLEARPTEGGARLAVEDDGPGIPDSQMSLLFKPFSTTKKGGTGLGLPFCKKVVEEHSGAIRAERGSLGGARFVIELPGARESR
jgi:PAS domain S-box-containing protein